MIRAVPPVLSLAYLLLAHLASILDKPSFALAATAILLALVLFAPLRDGRAWAWFALATGAALLAWLTLSSRDLAMLPLYAPPVLVNLFFAWLFGRTLAAGSQPLIERFARALAAPGETLDSEVLKYARRITSLWTLLFLGLAVLNLVLALLASPGGLLLSGGIVPPVAVPRALWSWFANIFNYLIVGAFFVGEYCWRRRRFASLPHRRFADFCRRVVQLPASVWREQPR